MPATHKKQQWSYTHRVVLVTMAPPSVRMVLIKAAAEVKDGQVEAWSWLYPVVALRTSVVNQYSRRGEWPGHMGLTHEELLADGWLFREQEERISAIVIDKEYGLSAHDDESLRASNVISALEVCPWPIEEDDARLQLRHQALMDEISQQEVARVPRVS